MSPFGRSPVGRPIRIISDYSQRLSTAVPSPRVIICFMDEQQNPQSSEGGEQKFGAPPAPEVNVRTMASDTSSIQRGESMPVPESVLPPETEKEPTFRPETQVGESMGMAMEEEKPPSKGRKVLVVSLLVVIVIGVGLAGYYFVYPLLSRTEPAPPPEALPPAEPSAEPPAVLTAHNSFFFPRPAEVSEVRLSSLLLTTITSALQALAANRLPNGTLQEAAILDSAGSQISFSSYLPAFLPSLSSSQLSSWFEDDFTAFLYYDGNGVWPGYVARVKNGVNLDEVRSNLTVLESGELTRFYLSPAGAFGAFRDGQVNGRGTRYAVGGVPGSAFNYGIFGNYVLVSASYDGLKSAAPLLGL